MIVQASYQPTISTLDEDKKKLQEQKTSQKCRIDFVKELGPE